MKRKQYSAAFKAQVVLECLRETKTISQLASEHNLHPNLINKWKQAALTSLPQIYERDHRGAVERQAQEQKMDELYQEIGRLTTQLNWLKKKAGYGSDSF
jgi:transposase